MKMPITAVFLLFFLSLTVFSGCESDPLLSPQSGADDAKGSYGFTSFPGAEASEKKPKSNPELF